MFRTVLGLLLLAALPCGPAVAETTAADTVTRFHQQLAESMRLPACEARLAKLAPAVDGSFDMPFIAERALRRHWKTLDADGRARFTAALRQSVLTTYATEFASPGAVRFETGASETLANGDGLVHAQLVPAQGGPVALDYQLRRRGENWQVVNVLAEGVSDLALRATQYDGLMKQQGLPGLLERLDDQTRQLRARCP